MKLYYTTNTTKKGMIFGVLDKFLENQLYESSKNWLYKAKIGLIDYITIIMLNKITKDLL